MQKINIMKMNNKVCIVTGASGIIGSKVCEFFLRSGAKIAMFDINKTALFELEKKLQIDFPMLNIMAEVCDVSNPKNVNDSIKNVLAKWNQIDVLHNNAASKSDNLDAFFESFEEYSLEEWRKIMSVNVDGMMLMAQAVGKAMLKNPNGGSIIQTASIYGVVGPDQRIYEGSNYLNRQINSPAVYSASKGAVIALTRYLATYWGTKGIRVNTITPGGVESGQNKTFIEKYSNRVPMGRMAKAEEIASAVLFLASDDSKYMTGQNLIVDGGLTAW